MVVYYIDKRKNDKEAMKKILNDTQKTFDEINDLLYFDKKYSF